VDTKMATSAVDELVLAAADLPAATLHEAAGRIGALPSRIRPIRPGMRVVGRAFPVTGGPGDNLWLHRAVYEAAPGDVLVVVPASGEAPEYGYWGEVLAVAALERGIAGLVIDGGVRDAVQLESRGFPTFAARICLRGTGKNPDGPGSLGEDVVVGDVTVSRGDLLIGDDDGVVVIPADEARDAVDDGHRRESDEIEIFRRLAEGESTISVYSLPEQVS